MEVNKSSAAVGHDVVIAWREQKRAHWAVELQPPRHWVALVGDDVGELVGGAMIKVVGAKVRGAIGKIP